jgi:hypothetical protein
VWVGDEEVLWRRRGEGIIYDSEERTTRSLFPLILLFFERFSSDLILQ